MSLSIMSNISAEGAARSLGINNRALQENISHLSSGLRISSAADDAAGLAISQEQTSDVNALQQAARNANDGISMVQVASGAMSQQATVLSRMKELAVQASNGTYSASQVADTNTEFQSLINEVQRISQSTSFNGVNMLSAGSTVTMQVGASTSASDQIAVTFGKTDSTTLGVAGLDLTVSPSAALTAINTAISTLSTAQATAGAAQNQLQSAADNATDESTNLSASVSQIRDVDVATESSDLARNNVLVQAGTAVLAQANQQPQAALSLLRG